MQINTLLEKIVNFSKNFSDVEKVILFGSFARGDFRPKSDIDLAVLCREDSFYRIQDWIEDSNLTLRKIDLIHLGNISKDFTEEIIQTGKVLYERKNSESS